jgi:hypothetical protein
MVRKQVSPLRGFAAAVEMTMPKSFAAPGPNDRAGILDHRANMSLISL